MGFWEFFFGIKEPRVSEHIDGKTDETRGLIYRVLLTSDKDYFMVEDKKISLIPGMAVTAEIKTRQKRIIEYFLEPFKTYASEGLRER